jgi:hypothetical protein
MIIYAFWAVFYLLNGVEKFVRPDFPPGYTCEMSPKEYIQQHPEYADRFVKLAEGRYVPRGWYGVNRTCQIGAFFKKLNLPQSWVDPALYFAGFYETTLGLIFLYMLLKALFGAKMASHALHRMAFKLSIMQFFGFITLGTLVGDRTELWEWVSYLSLIILTYGVYVYRNELRRHVLAEMGMQPIEPISTPTYERAFDEA